MNQICWKGGLYIYRHKLFCKVARITYIYKQDCEIHITWKTYCLKDENKIASQRKCWGKHKRRVPRLPV